MKYIILSFWIYVFRMTICSIVYTDRGAIEGKLVRDNVAHYYSYTGIPYAEPPIGYLRFMPPVPKEPWTGILNASEEGPVCPQTEGVYNYSAMNEDCLFLNIYVPFANEDKLLPVLFYVHGGEFQTLSGNADKIYGPQFYISHDVIVVTANYRLGALGFLSLDIPEASGNAGLKDVILALTWINNNIEQFGGDSSKITIGGNSAGAALVHYLLLTKKTEGLFHQAFLISGSATGYRFLARHNVEIALNLASYLQLNSSNKTELLQELRNLDVTQFIDAQNRMRKDDKRSAIRPFAPFVPCVEINSRHSVITEEPKELLKSGLVQNVPILAGFNAQEGIKMLPEILKNPELIENINENFELSIPSDIEYPYGSEESVQLANSIREFYFDNDTISNVNLSNFIEYITDTHFFYSINSWIKHCKWRNYCNILYYYMFDFDGDLNWFKIKNDIKLNGTSHADELGYMFITEVTKDRLTSLDRRSELTMNNMLQYWTNFIKYGNPNSCEIGKSKWQPTDTSGHYLKINDKPMYMATSARRQSFEFWCRVYDDYYDYLRNGGEIQAKIIP